MLNTAQYRHIRQDSGWPRNRFGQTDRAARQCGMTLIDFMVGITVGLLVVLAAVGSLAMIRSSARTLSDSAALEQQASLVMMQIGQQISQAGSVNAVLSNGGDKVNFDTHPVGIEVPGTNPQIYSNVFGTTDANGGSDTLTISYIAPNDGSPAFNCIGGKGQQSNGVVQIVNIFSVNPTSHDLRCGDQSSVQPIASNVVDMRVKYLFIQNNGNITYQSAALVASTDWINVNGVQICLEMQGNDTVQAPAIQNMTDCQGNSRNVIDNNGHIHRIINQTFYLRNN
jgi:type IV pilus assembly protein PilW